MIIFPIRSAETYLQYLLDAFGASAPPLSGGWVMAPPDTPSEALKQFEIGGVTSPGRSDASLNQMMHDLFTINLKYTISFYDPISKPGDLNYAGDLPVNLLESDYGNYFTYKISDFSVDSIREFRSYCISSYKFAFVLEGSVCFEKDRNDIINESVMICASCFDDESWLGANVIRDGRPVLSKRPF